jgi:3-hydroxybutyryl-CoA dehydrogenase
LAEEKKQVANLRYKFAAMNILLIGTDTCNSLFGKPFPFEGFTCRMAKEPIADDLAFADFIIDLSFEEHPERKTVYSSNNKPVLIGSVIQTLRELNVQDQQPVARFNHWPGFINRSVIELSVHESQQHLFTAFFTQLSVAYYVTADVPGFVSARTVSMIINEAFLTRQEAVSTEDEIDTAMQLGTGYPMGPFAWSRQIGLQRIAALLQKLAATDVRYQPASTILNTTAVQ